MGRDGLFLLFGLGIGSKIMDLAGENCSQDGDANHAAEKDSEYCNACRVSLT